MCQAAQTRPINSAPTEVSRCTLPDMTRCTAGLHALKSVSTRATLCIPADAGTFWAPLLAPSSDSNCSFMYNGMYTSTYNGYTFSQFVSALCSLPCRASTVLHQVPPCVHGRIMTICGGLTVAKVSQCMRQMCYGIKHAQCAQHAA